MGPVVDDGPSTDRRSVDDGPSDVPQPTASVVVTTTNEVITTAGEGLRFVNLNLKSPTVGSEPMTSLVSTCIWRTTPALIVALDERFGEPVDAYVNGSQVWLRDDGPGGITLEWRLHPVAGYRCPEPFTTYDIFSATALTLAQGTQPVEPVDQLWDGLEAFVAFEERLEPVILARSVTDALGIAPDGFGLADHQEVGDLWEARGGKVSIIEALLEQLTTRIDTKDPNGP